VASAAEPSSVISATRKVACSACDSITGSGGGAASHRDTVMYVQSEPLERFPEQLSYPTLGECGGKVADAGSLERRHIPEIKNNSSVELHSAVDVINPHKTRAILHRESC
jgi:hypothetical protein